MEEDKELYAEKLTKKAMLAVKIMIVLAAVTVAVAVGLVIFALVARFTQMSQDSAVIGIAVFVVCIIVLLLAVFGVFVYAKINLNKLKKLG